MAVACPIPCQSCLISLYGPVWQGLSNVSCLLSAQHKGASILGIVMHSINNINSLTKDSKKIFTVSSFLITITLVFSVGSTGNHMLMVITYKK